MLWDEAKVWALRHWPDMNIFNHNQLAYIIETYHQHRGRSMTCIPVEIDKESCILFVVYSKYDRISTPRKHRQFSEGEQALKYKANLFTHEEDKELAEKSQFTTVADPFGEWASELVSFYILYL